MVTAKCTASLARALGTLAALLSICSAAEAGSLRLGWDPNPESDVAGYIVYYGTSSGIYASSADLGNITQWTASSLVDGVRYYFAVRAYNSSGLQNALSAEITGVPTRPIARIGVTPSSATIKVGETANFTAQAFDASDSPLPSVPLTWTTSNSAIARVSGDDWCHRHRYRRRGRQRGRHHQVEAVNRSRPGSS